jgi:hypothetical protein
VPVVDGLTKNIRSSNLLVIAFYEYVAIVEDLRDPRSMSERWHRFFSGPGWTAPEKNSSAQTL